MKKLSIVIPSYNMGTKVDQCLESIFDSEADQNDYEVVVCDSSDDCSMDAWKKWVEKHGNVKVVHSSRRVSIGPSRNTAVKHAEGEYVFCLDVDDRFYDRQTLKKLIDGLDGKDMYVCSYWSRKDGILVKLNPKNFVQLASCPVACWTKAYKRELYVPFPSYMPEDVLPHYLLCDRVRTYGSFDFPVVDYDNTPDNKGAISRTFDWLLQNPSNLIQLAQGDVLGKMGLREEFVAGVIHNLADMWQCRGKISNQQVKAAYMFRLKKEYQNFMSGLYIH